MMFSRRFSILYGVLFCIWTLFAYGGGDKKVVKEHYVANLHVVDKGNLSNIGTNSLVSMMTKLSVKVDFDYSSEIETEKRYLYYMGRTTKNDYVVTYSFATSGWLRKVDREELNINFLTQIKKGDYSVSGNDCGASYSKMISELLSGYTYFSLSQNDFRDELFSTQNDGNWKKESSSIDSSYCIQSNTKIIPGPQVKAKYKQKGRDWSFSHFIFPWLKSDECPAAVLEKYNNSSWFDPMFGTNIKTSIWESEILRGGLGYKAIIIIDEESDDVLVIEKAPLNKEFTVWRDSDAGTKIDNRKRKLDIDLSAKPGEGVFSPEAKMETEPPESDQLTTKLSNIFLFKSVKKFWPEKKRINRGREAKKGKKSKLVTVESSKIESVGANDAELCSSSAKRQRTVFEPPRPALVAENSEGNPFAFHPALGTQPLLSKNWSWLFKKNN